MVQDWSTKDWSRLVLGLQRTGLEWSQSQSYNFVISLGPVLVLVFPKKAKKPDRTGLLNTMQAFHANKSAIITAGGRQGSKGPLEHWEIPKLELLKHVVASI